MHDHAAVGAAHQAPPALAAGGQHELAREGELSAYKHRGFWQPMDTLRDRNRLEELWQAGDPPWRLWQ